MTASIKRAGARINQPIPTEHQEQAAFVAWCDLHPIAKHIFAIPNGANKSPAARMKFKREGLRAGVPDLFLPVRRNDGPEVSRFGLFIEMKRKGEKPSLSQLQWHHYLRKQDYEVRVCYSADEAIKAVKEYLA